ncbi:hypothetical protein V1277_004240 [Bradyrhizobium sp. AZCC 1588]|uniref:hypothetical protein n=1 Tax=unclassified Bradyrhizobium TaxID=2631580 RepID=UPI002FF1A767
MPGSPMGLWAAWGFPMKKYSIVRIGSEYVVQAGDTSILKVSSRREAAKLVTDAAELLQEPAPCADEDPSIEREAPEAS